MISTWSYVALRADEPGEPRCYRVYYTNNWPKPIDPMDWTAVIEADSAEEAIRIVEASV